MDDAGMGLTRPAILLCWMECWQANSTVVFATAGGNVGYGGTGVRCRLGDGFRMNGKHARRSGVGRWIVLAILLLGLPALVATGLVVVGGEPWAVSSTSCQRKVKVVTATSFAPVLNTMTAGLAEAENCLRLEVVVADGRSAPQLVEATGADLWIPDDASWAGVAADVALARPGEDGTPGPGGAGTVVAESPIYMVTDGKTAGRIRSAGDSWLAFANLLSDPASGVKMVVRDPGTSGDGLVGAGAMAETVWIKEDMDASALILSQAFEVTRTVSGGNPALPEEAGEVGLVPEYALLPLLPTFDRNAALLAGKDYAVSLRYTFYPVQAAADDPARSAALADLLAALNSPPGTAAIGAAGLRNPRAEGEDKAPPEAQRLPSLAKEPMRVLGGHHVDHVLATWYIQDRRTDLLMVVDASGSMDDPVPGTKTPLMQLVRQGCRSLESLLPDDSRVGLWEFGTKLDPPRDYRPLLAPAALNAAHRQATVDACGKLRTRSTGTGLYDTVLGAYTAAKDTVRDGVPNRVLIFTDGLNSDASSITLPQLKAGLAKAHDPARPVYLSVVVFGGGDAPVEAFDDAIGPVDGYLDVLTSAAEVSAVFIHVAAGGLHG
jgi:hypothetical protein